MRGIELVSDRLAAWLTPEDARALLKRKLGGEVSLLDQLAGTRALNHALTCKALVASCGFDVLFELEIRKALLRSVSGQIVDEIWGGFHLGEISNAHGAEERRATLIGLSIHRGTYRARRLCEVFDLPYECAGDALGSATPASEAFPPQIDLPPLHDYQEELAAEIRTELLGVRADNRAMLTLPTGGGKTRVILETLINWEPIECGMGTLLWVAQHNELCEQAIECVAQIWASRKRPGSRSIKVQRVWGGKSSEIDWSCDVVVGIPESLSDRLLEDVSAAQKRLRVIVIDEAHLAVAKLYDPVFQAAGVTSVPVLGVSATPANLQTRSGVLQECFDGRLLKAPSLGENPYAILRDRGVLSEVLFEGIDSGETVRMSDGEREDLRESRGDFSKSILGKLGNSISRNRTIVQNLLRLPRGVPTLGFASSVDGARALASAMAILGREASVIDATTPQALRKKILADFKSGITQFLFNYGVLATGFDAPLVECLLMARPTRSAVLLEQMVGRGLRGPKNGGTTTCRLLWIEDHFANAEELQPQSYQRFANLWKAERG